MGDVVKLDRDRRRRPEVSLVAPDGTPPPHDVDAERALVSGAFLVPLGNEAADRDQRARVDRVHELVRPEMFYDPTRGRVWSAIGKLRESGTPVDIVTVTSQLRGQAGTPPAGGWGAYLAELVDATPAIGNIEAHAAAVVDMWERREIIRTCLEVQAEARTPSVEHEANKASWRRDLGKVTSPRVKLAGRTIGEVANAVSERVKEGNSRIIGVRYGLVGLEQRFGILARGRQHVLCGRSEHGKTALACQIAWNVASTPLDAAGMGEAVYIMSGEMPAETLLFRAAATLADVDVQRIELGWADADEMEEFGRQLAWLRTLPIVIDDQPAPPEEIARRVRARQADFAEGRARRVEPDGSPGELFPRSRLQLTIGDHLQELATLAPPIPGERDLIRQIGATALGWRDHIAKGCRVATLLLSQLTRAVADPKAKRRWPVAADLWGGTPIESSADTILGVQRPELLGGKVLPRQRGTAGVVTMKSRMGGSRRILWLGFQRGRFTDDLPPHAREAPHYEDDADDDT